MVANQSTDTTTSSFDGFTEAAYAAILVDLKRNYTCQTFGSNAEGRHALWRHDIDCSVHRAAALARIEHDAGIKATYFFMLHSEFYNLLEGPVLERARRILEHGHHAGLHFDLNFYDLPPGDLDVIERKLGDEKRILEDALGSPVDVFSFHNPDIGNALQYDQDRMAGMINTYGRRLREDYQYVSDSNGLWRFDPLPSIVRDAKAEKLHVLTHPVWWTPTAMSPRARIARCVDGRAADTLRGYDELLAQHERPNVT